MKNINIYAIAAITAFFFLSSCEEEQELNIPIPYDITFNELELDRFTYDIKAAPFTAGDNDSGIITVNATGGSTTTYTGFLLSNRNVRHYPWSLSPDWGLGSGGLASVPEEDIQLAIDSTAVSVYTDKSNGTENYLVGNTDNDDAFFTLSEPAIIEHILVSNTSYNFLLAEYGSTYSGSFDSTTQLYRVDDGASTRSNPNVPTGVDISGRFNLPAPNGYTASRLSSATVLAQRAADEAAYNAAYDAAIAGGSTVEEAGAAGEAAEDATPDVAPGYVKLTIEGLLNDASTGSFDFYLAAEEGADPLHPEWDFILDDWVKVDLTELGIVDKILFKMSSSYVDEYGDMIYPPTFCLDGIRIQKQ